MTSPISVPFAIFSPVREKHEGFTGCNISCMPSLSSGNIGSGSDVIVTISAPVVASQTRIVQSSAEDRIRSPEKKFVEWLNGVNEIGMKIKFQERASLISFLFLCYMFDYKKPYEFVIYYNTQ
jgi:hypothetical protein